MSASTNSQAVLIDGLTKRYEATTGGDNAEVAVHDLSLSIAEGEFFSIVGPSGCGKTTTLRCVAGLESVDRGRILLHDRVVNDSESGTFVPPERRKIALVFQSYAIWPHMSVFENVAFPLRVGKRSTRASRAEVKERVDDALERVELTAYATRRPADLSGGQQQRIALARAVVTEPELLLLDEPLSNLDARLKERMKFELRELQMRLGVTTINVTHDQAEALAVSDRIAVLDHGSLVQLGTPTQLYFEPRTRFVARFISRSNTVSGTITGLDGSGRPRVALGPPDAPAMTLVTSPPLGDGGIPSRASRGDEACVAIRPESVRLATDRSGPDRAGPDGTAQPGGEASCGDNEIAAELVVIGLSDGGALEGRVRLVSLPEVEWTVRWSATSGPRPAPGSSLLLRVSPSDCLLVSRDTADRAGSEGASGVADETESLDAGGAIGRLAAPPAAAAPAVGGSDR